MTKFQIHVVLYKTETENGNVTCSDILEEEEPEGHGTVGKGEFDDEDVARYVFSQLTGVDVNRR